MYSINVNGKMVESLEDKTLIRFLRDDLRLTSVKDGCSEGACGTCTVLIDGKAMRSCIPKISQLEHKKIITMEGLTDREKEIYSTAFAKEGAVQCGFCIPGMILSGKALLDHNPDPTRIEVAATIRNNICRCTGYQKIIQGILLAAKMFREDIAVTCKNEIAGIGANIQRIDATRKALGTGIYADDIYLEDMVYASAVRSAYPRAIVKEIHTEKACALPGVIGIFTAADIPGSVKVGHIKQDWDTLIPVGGTTRYVGDAICLVVGESLSVVEEAKRLVEITYEVLTPVRDPFEAMKADAPVLHDGGNLLADVHLRRGDVEQVIANAPYKVTNHYETPWTEHAFLEPECAVAMPFDDGVFIYSGDQGTYDTQRETAQMLGLPREKVIVENALVGGGFGGKEDVTVQHLAALAAYRTGRIVKMKLSRKESIAVHPKRHPMWMEVTTACDEQGILMAFKAEVIADTGAYASLGGPVLQRACTHAAGPYRYQAVAIEGKAYYTNNPPAGAFRGFGVTQTCFASESNLNQLAELVGITPWQIRHRNAVRPGDVLPNGQIADAATGILETLEAVKEICEKEPYAGLACAMKNAGVGVGLPDWGRCRLLIRDGIVQIHAAASCIGQGVGTVLTQMVSETTGLTVENIAWQNPNTSKAPDSGTTSGSRQTLITGEATRRAAEKLCLDLKEYSLSELEGREYLGEYLAKTDAMGSDVPNPVSHVAYGYATQVCILNPDGTVQKIIAVHDVGKAVNPISVEGQIEGGVVMGMGYALTEQYVLEDCIPKSRFGTLGLFRADKIPVIEPVIIEKPGIQQAYGAIGIGEITSIPTAPAIAGAYHRWNHEFQTVLPLKGTPYRKTF